MPTPTIMSRRIEAEQDVERGGRLGAGCRSPGGTDPLEAIATATRSSTRRSRPSSGASSRASHRDTLHRLVRRPPIEECWPRPAVMGVVNVTPDSFSDGGDNLDSRDAAATARRLLADGAAVVDIGGESTRPGSAGRHRGRGAASGRAGPAGAPGQPVSIDTRRSRSRQSDRARGRARERRHGPSGRSGPGGARRRRGRVSLPHAHAGRASHDAGGAAVRQRRRRRGVVPRGAARGRRRRRGARGARLPRPRHRLREDARPEPRAHPGPRPDLPDRAARARRALAQEHAGAGHWATRTGASARTSASVGAAVAAFDRGAACSASTTSPRTSRRSPPPPRWSGGASR